MCMDITGRQFKENVCRFLPTRILRLMKYRMGWMMMMTSRIIKIKDLLSIMNYCANHKYLLTKDQYTLIEQSVT